MSTNTTNFNLVKPALTDAADITAMNGNWDTIDTELNKIGGKQATITGAASSITTNNLTASKALVSDASGKVAVSSVTDTELGYLSGVTSAIQTQISGKQATITGGASSIVSSDLTTSRALVSNSSGKVSTSTATSTEVGYLSGVTSSIQSQLNGKQGTITYSTTDLTPGTSALTTGEFYAYYE